MQFFLEFFSHDNFFLEAQIDFTKDNNNIEGWLERLNVPKEKCVVCIITQPIVRKERPQIRAKIAFI